MYKFKAINNLYSNAVTISEDNDVFTVRDENENEVSIDMSAVNAKAIELETEEDNAKQAQADLKASAKAKLIAGEALTEEEANTIVL
jgi:hypothetical protein